MERYDVGLGHGEGITAERTGSGGYWIPQTSQCVLCRLNIDYSLTTRGRTSRRGAGGYSSDGRCSTLQTGGIVTAQLTKICSCKRVNSHPQD